MRDAPYNTIKPVEPLFALNNLDTPYYILKAPIRKGLIFCRSLAGGAARTGRFRAFRYDGREIFRVGNFAGERTPNPTPADVKHQSGRTCVEAILHVGRVRRVLYESHRRNPRHQAACTNIDAGEGADSEREGHAAHEMQAYGLRATRDDHDGATR
ncbi:MAG: hypothetical protein ACRERE_19945 [Candidatus Entotheonellia bacterium]